MWYDTEDREYEEKPRARGVRKSIRPHLGKALGKYSYCGCCDRITFNVQGKTYCDRPLEEHEPSGWVLRDGKQVTVTRENQADLFFACEVCGNEKFWAWGNCPVCDYDRALVLETTTPEYDSAAAMEFGGNPMNWSEKWKCLMCGHVYWISNSNY